MKSKIVDANVIIRYLVEAPDKIPAKFKGVYSFFERLERKDAVVELPELVLFEVFFVLTSHYEVPQAEAAEKLSAIAQFSGVEMSDKPLVLACLEILRKKKVGLVDAYVCALAKKRGDKEVFSFDGDLKKLGLSLAKVE